MIKINNQDLRFLAEKYNSDGKQAMYAYLQSEYGIKNPTCTFKRMKKHPELGYHPTLFCRLSVVWIDSCKGRTIKPIKPDNQKTKNQEFELLVVWLFAV